MNILFLYDSIFDPDRGGVQRVSRVLGNYFSGHGHQVYYLSLDKKIRGVFIDAKQYILPKNNSFLLEENIAFFKNFLVVNEIDFVINQGGHDPKCSEFSYFAGDVGVKVFSVIHNSLLSSVRNFRFSKSPFFSLNIFKSSLFDFLILKIYWLKYKKHYRNLCYKSDKILLLSDQYKKELQFFLSEDISNKVSSLPNPCTFSSFSAIEFKKEKVLVYIGRVDFSQKRIDLLLEVWNKIHLDFKDWKLKIIGDGPDFDLANKMCDDLKIERVYFEGFQDPKKYYENASIFCMTSSFEGFPMVLLEAMAYGVVPIAFNSFESISDIICDQKNGLIIKPFDVTSYSHELSRLMLDDNRILNMSKICKNKSDEFAIDIVGDRWIQLMNNQLK